MIERIDALEAHQNSMTQGMTTTTTTAIDDMVRLMVQEGAEERVARSIATLEQQHRDGTADVSRIDILQPGASLDDTTVTLLGSPQADPPTQLASLIGRFKAAYPLNQLNEDMSYIMQSVNDYDWKCGVITMRHTISVESFSACGFEAPLAEDQGARPMLLCVKANCWRTGAACFPLQGLPMIIAPFGTSIVVSLVEVLAVVEMGTPTVGLPNFLASAAGKAYSNEHAKLYRVGANEAIYIPPGCLVAVMYPCDSEQARSTPMAFAAVIPIFSQTTVQKIGERAWSSIATANSLWFDSRRSFSWRGKLFKEFMAQLQQAPSA